VLTVMADFDGSGICYCCGLHTVSGNEFEEVLRKKHTCFRLRSKIYQDQDSEETSQA
jgi:hypothetical protein